MVNGNPTQLSTVNAVFLKGLAIADELETECIVLTFDFAFYAKAQQVHWNDAMDMQRTVVRPCEFHTCMLFLSVIGKRFDDSGLADILLEAGTVAQGSLPGVMKGRHYNRSVRVIKVMSEALRRKLLSTFIETQSEEEKAKFIALSKDLYHAFPKTQFQYLCTSSDFKEFESKLLLFIQERCSQFPTFTFWMSYLNMADLFLNFIRAIQTGDWAFTLNQQQKWYLGVLNMII